MPVAFDVAIIGAGPAGMAAALQLKRCNIPFILFDKNISSGSLLVNAWRVENLLGVPATAGVDLLRQFRKQLEQNAIAITAEEIIALDYLKAKQEFRLLAKQNSYNAKYVIMASGTKANELALIAALPSNLQQAIYSEVFPLLGIKNKDIVIIGAGDAAFDYAINLAERGNRIYIKNKSFKINALQKLQVKIQANSNIIYDADSSLLNILPGERKKLKCEFANCTKNRYVETDYLITAIGRSAAKDFLTPNLLQIETDLIAEGKLIFAGDVANGSLRQVAIALGDGIAAAMQMASEF